MRPDLINCAVAQAAEGDSEAAAAAAEGGTADAEEAPAKQSDADALADQVGLYS